MSFSRRIGAAPSIKKWARVSELVMTLSPIMIRSNGFNSTFSAIASSLANRRSAARVSGNSYTNHHEQYPNIRMQNCIKKKAFASSTEQVSGGVRRRHRGFKEKRRGPAPPIGWLETLLRLLQELEHALLRLVGERERGDRDRLAGRQRLAVGRLLVGVGQGQVGRPGLQHIDDVLREILADLHDGKVGAERRGLGAQRAAGVVERGQHLACQHVVDEVGAGGELCKAEAIRVEADSRNRQRRLAGFVEDQLQRVAVQKVDAVERRILRRGLDLVNDLIVLSDQGGTRGLRNRVGNRCNDRTADAATERI